jgi:hypothetical protein
LRHLRFVILDDSRVGDPALVQLAQLPELESLYVERTQVTEAGIARLHKTCPDVHVHW